MIVIVFDKSVADVTIRYSYRTICETYNFSVI